MPEGLVAPAKVIVEVPATTANLGPGFDTLGMALDLVNTVSFEAEGHSDSLEEINLTIGCSGEGERSLSKGPDNLAFRVASRVFAAHGRYPKRLHIQLRNSIPLARGLGSSAATTVGALLAAEAVLGIKSPASAVFDQGLHFEGHVDNLAPALLGGITLGAVLPDGPKVIRREPPAGLIAIAAIPSFALKTSDARRALPATVPHSDAVYNLSRTAFVWNALLDADWETLNWAMSDRLHQPYRSALVPGFDSVCQAALQAGAIAVALSGAGPTVIAFWSIEYNSASAEGIGKSMEKAFSEAGVVSRSILLNPTPLGASVSLERR